MASVGMLILLLDTKTAISGAVEGINLCALTVVPALFPFIVLSSAANTLIMDTRLPFVNVLGRLCRMPAGTEPIMLLGMLGGYPVGAACIGQAYANHRLDQKDAKRLLGFCSNAGPGFIFGMTASLFSSPVIPWMIWSIQIVSAVLTGILLRGGSHGTTDIPSQKPLGFTGALLHGLRITAVICGWVILFRIIIAFSERWFLWLFPEEAAVLYSGLLELANGCHRLKEISSEGLRFVLCCTFLSFGGVCVAMQTASVSGGLGCLTYLQGKLLQCTISFLLSCLLQNVLYSQVNRGDIPIPLILVALPAALALSGWISPKKAIAFLFPMMYNGEKM